ncbi:MAG: ABC transporter substrate-binding protein [Dysgonamonadaceae bacterium]|jgi:iron complex transport system substrate-binding protein|nr:ABC transporter substrate-binding protein [Dysgonamonadaceae bacterium]
MKTTTLLLSLCFLLAFPSCKKQESLSESATFSDSLHYAEGFRIEPHPGYILVTVQNPWNKTAGWQRYVLVPKTTELPAKLPEGILIRTPLQRTVSYGAVPCTFFAELNVLQTLAGVCEPQYINLAEVQEGVNQGRIANLGTAANPNQEKIRSIDPEAIFASPLQNTGDPSAQSGIPWVACMDYMEATPLGRAEWIRFYGVFFEKEQLADSLFALTAKNYTDLKKRSESVDYHPTVFAETIYSGVWYMPGGNSYAAHLFRDAGADYLWKNDSNTGSISLSFESVLDKAEKADYWLIKYNSRQELTYTALALEYANYAFFDAFKQKRIYACNTGKTPYYEELPIHPERVLKDLIGIFHPELTPGDSLRYYQPLKQYSP